MLIVINTWNRAELFAQTLAVVQANKHADSRIGVVDDHTWFWKAPSVDFVWRSWYRRKVGMARRFALECCLQTNENLFCIMDNDLLVTPGFDFDMANLWMEYRDRHPGCIASPFRAEVAEHLERDLDFGDYVFSTATSGCMLLLDRPLIERLLTRMPVKFWTDYWDWALCGFINGCIKPRITYARHIGYDRWAVHPTNL